MNIGTLTGVIAIEDQLSGALTIATAHVRRFAEGFDGALGATAIGLGAVAAGIGAVTAGVISLGNQGSDVNDVADAMENFAGSAAEAEAIMTAMREGTLNTISDFNLMRTSSRLLSAGVKLNAQDFSDLSRASFVLQNQGFGPTKEILDNLTMSILRGNDRMIRRMGITVDMTSAEINYANSIGKTVDQLGPTEKLEARRIGIIDALHKKVGQLSGVHRDFGEQMEFAVAQIKNFTNELASQVAASPNVMNAVNQIGIALVNTFGGDTDQMIQSIVGWINNFADAVATYGPKIITVLGQITEGISSIWQIVTKIWSLIPDWFKNMAVEAIPAAAAIWGITLAIKALTAAEAVAGLTRLATGFGALVTATRNWILIAGTFYSTTALAGTAVAGFGAALLTLAGTPLGMAALFVGLAVGIWKTVDALKGLFDTISSGKSVWEFLTAKDEDTFLRRWLGLSKAVEGVTTNVQLALAPVISYEQRLQRVGAVAGVTIEQLDRGSEALEKNEERMRLAAEEAKKYADELKKLSEQYSGKGLLTQAKQYEDVLKQIGGATSLTVAEQNEFSKAFDQVIDKYRLMGPLGAEIVRHFTELKTGLRNASAEQTEYERALAFTYFRLDMVAEEQRRLIITMQEIDRVQQASLLPNYTQQWGDLNTRLRELTNVVPPLTAYIRQNSAEVENATAKVADWAQESREKMIQSVQDLSRALADLAQVSGDSFGAIVRGISQLVSSFAVATQAFETFKKGLEALRSGGGSMLGSIATIATGILGIGSAIGTVIGVAAGFFKKLFGGPSEAELAGREAANAFRKGLVETLTQSDWVRVNSLVAGGANKVWAETVVAIQKAYLEAGRTAEEALAAVDRLWRAEKKGPEAAQAAIEEINRVIEDHKKKVEETKRAVEEFRSEFTGLLTAITESGRLASKTFLDVIKVVQQTGQMTSEINAFLGANAKNAAAGLMQFIENASFKTVGGAQAAAGAFAVAFDQMVKSGMSAADALRFMGPSINEFKKNLREMGIEGGSAFETIDRMAQYMADEGFAKAITAVEGLNMTLVGLNNAGLLTQDMFTGLSGEITATFDSLVAKGYQGDEVIRLMAPSLQTVWELMTDFGFQVDDATAKLVEQGVQAGLVGEKHRDVNERIAHGIDRITQLLEVFITAMGIELPTAITKATTSTLTLGETQTGVWKGAKRGAEDLLDVLDETTVVMGDQGRVAEIVGTAHELINQNVADSIVVMQEVLTTFIETMGVELPIATQLQTEATIVLQETFVSMWQTAIDGAYEFMDLFEEMREKISEPITIDIHFDVDKVDLPSGTIPGFQHGTNGFQHFNPGGELAVLHGEEAVVPRSRLGDFVGRYSGGNRETNQTIIVKLNDRVMARATAKNLPKVLEVYGVR